MQTDYLFNGIKGFKRLRNSQLYVDKNPIAEHRLEIVNFYKRFGLEVTMSAYKVSARTIYRYQATCNRHKDISELNPKSTKPKNLRKSNFSPLIKQEIKRLREKYLNLGKDRLFHLLKPFCQTNGLKCPSISSIGRIIAKEPDKMRITPLRIDRNGKPIKARNRIFKDRKPKNLQTKPMKSWAMDTIEYVNASMRKYILTMVDLDTRIAYATALPSKKTRYTSVALKALLQGLKVSKENKIEILTDNGSEFAKDYEKIVKERGLKHYFTYPRCPKMNASCERFNRTLKESFAEYNKDLLFTDLNEFNRMLGDWLVDYNCVLPHSSLGYKTPLAYAIEKDPKNCQMLWTSTDSRTF